MSDVQSRLKTWLTASISTALLLILVASHSVTGEGLVSIAWPEAPAKAPEKSKPLLAQIQEQGRLIVLTRNAPNTYYIERDEPAGFEHDLAQAYGAFLGVDVEFRPYDSTPKLLKALENGEGHIIASNLIAGDVPEGDLFALGPAYDAVRQQLVCHRNARVPNSKAELHTASVKVVTESSYEERMKALAQDVPGLQWVTKRDLSTEDLMERVADRSIGCTVGDSTTVALNRRYFPDLSVPFDLSGPEPMSWAVPAQETELRASLNYWFGHSKTRKLLKSLHEHYYGHVPTYDYVDLLYFSRRVKERLPRYKKTFKREAKKHGLPWTLVAAMGYQESHWRSKAKSPTGVRGLMMLTLPTAKDLGIKNRLDATQSIRGGAKYIAGLIKRLPSSIQGEDRLWIAIASYNVGLGHVLDARKLAKRLGRNPDSWADLKITLPLLTQPAFYNSLTYGYARGNEPVRYVQRVRHYQDILENQFTAPAWNQAMLEPEIKRP
jgi:membrane-bound lytic murein transglycosylase F